CPRSAGGRATARRKRRTGATARSFPGVVLRASAPRSASTFSTHLAPRPIHFPPSRNRRQRARAVLAESPRCVYVPAPYAERQRPQGLPGPPPRLADLLGRARLRADAGLRPGSRRRNDEPGHIPARARSGALERRLRRAFAPAGGRPLR